MNSDRVITDAIKAAQRLLWHRYDLPDATIRSAVKRAVVLRTIKAELDCVHSAYAQRERRKADHYPDQYTGDEAPLEDYQRDTSERYVFDKREIPPRIEQPSIKQVQTTVEQQTAQDKLRHVSEKAGAGR